MSTGVKVVVLVFVLALLGAIGWKLLLESPDKVVTKETICPNGTVLCPNHCLKAEDEGWRQMHVEGHPDTDRWMIFTNAAGKWEAYNQGHIGHVIENRNGKFTDVGVCPICKGTTRVCR